MPRRWKWPGRVLGVNVGDEATFAELRICSTGHSRAVKADQAVALLVKASAMKQARGRNEEYDLIQIKRPLWGGR